MVAPKLRTAKKYFTAAQANAMLPLVRAIVRDLAELAGAQRERHRRLSRMNLGSGTEPTDAYKEEFLGTQAEFERGHDQMREYEEELQQLGVELKDYFTGLIDFPSWQDDHEVYLCWRLGELEVSHWHELDAGFQGRQKLKVEAEAL
jgi:hypothetical protein